MSNYLNSIVSFRAIAMVYIVAGHGVWAANIGTESFADIYLKNVLLGGTTFFVFISGFLFHHVFFTRYKFGTFFWKKIRYVFIPYAVLSPIFIYDFVQRNSTLSDSQLSLDSTEIIVTNLIAAIIMFVTGSNFLAPYWFIPFILLTFAMSPLHFRFIKFTPTAQIVLISVFLVVAVLIHRPIGNFNTFQSLIYFTPVYLIGIFISQNRVRFLDVMKGREISLVLLALLIASIQAGIGDVGNYHKAAFSYDGIDLMLIQKIILSLALFSLLERHSKTPPVPLQIISRTSFAIYFLHPIFLFVMSRNNIKPLLGFPYLDLVVITILVTSLCVIVAEGAKKLLGSKSRYLIGY